MYYWKILGLSIHQPDCNCGKCVLPLCARPRTVETNPAPLREWRGAGIYRLKFATATGDRVSQDVVAEDGDPQTAINKLRARPGGFRLIACELIDPASVSAA